MIKAAIYDFDGTMANSEPLHARAWEASLEEYGYKFSDLPEQLRSSFLGIRVIDTAKEIAAYLKLNISSDKLYQKRVDAFLLLVEKELELMPGLLESLKLLKKYNYKLAIASSGAKKYIELVLNNFSIRDYFDVVVTEDDVKTGKPSPETYLVASKKLGFPPAECLVLEDATKGIQSAKAAGCFCIAVTTPNGPPQSYSDADLVINSLHDLSLDVIKRFSRSLDDGNVVE